MLGPASDIASHCHHFGRFRKSLNATRHKGQAHLVSKASHQFALLTLLLLPGLSALELGTAAAPVVLMTLKMISDTYSAAGTNPERLSAKKTVTTQSTRKWQLFHLGPQTLLKFRLMRHVTEPEVQLLLTSVDQVC